MTLTSSLGALVLRTMQWVKLLRRVLPRKEVFRIGIDIGSNAIRLVCCHLKQNAELSRLAIIDLIAGKKVLLTDLDPQANPTYSPGINNCEGNMAHVYEESRTLRSILVEKENMFILRCKWRYSPCRG